METVEWREIFRFSNKRQKESPGEIRRGFGFQPETASSNFVPRMKSAAFWA